jgi:hypothetical protein
MTGEAADSRRGASSQKAPGSRVWKYMAAVLAVAVAIALGASDVLRSSPDPEQARPVRPAPVRPDPRPSGPPAPRAWAMDVPVPAVRLPATMSLPVEGAEAERDAVLKAFDKAIGPYREGRYAEAAKALTDLAARRPDAPEIAFFLGVSRLLAGDTAAALEPLRAARDSTIVADDARWLEAVVLERTGRPAEADAALRPLCDVPGPYEQRACIILRDQ